MRPFSKKLWVAVFAWMLLATVCMFILVSYEKNTAGYFSPLYNSLEAFTNQCSSPDPASLNLRVAILMSRVVAMFIVPAYGAGILFYILIPTIRLPFTNMKEFVEDGSYKIAFAKESEFDSWFEVS